MIEFEPDLLRLPLGALKVDGLGPTSRFSLRLTVSFDICETTYQSISHVSLKSPTMNSISLGVLVGKQKT